MDSPENARTTPRGRMLIVRRLAERLSCWSMVVLPFDGCRDPGSVQGGRCAPPPSAASALSRPGLPACVRQSDRRGLHFALPCLSAPNDGVADGQQLAGDGDDGDEPGLAGVDQALVECLEGGVVTGGGDGAHERHGTHAGAAAVGSKHGFGRPCRAIGRTGGSRARGRRGLRSRAGRDGQVPASRPAGCGR